MDTYICQCTYKHGRFYKTGVLELNPRINGVETLTDWGVNIYLVMVVVQPLGRLVYYLDWIVGGLE